MPTEPTTEERALLDYRDARNDMLRAQIRMEEAYEVLKFKGWTRDQLELVIVEASSSEPEEARDA